MTCISQIIFAGQVVVKCLQTGKEIVVKPSHLAPEDNGHLSMRHFVPGHGLMF